MKTTFYIKTKQSVSRPIHSIESCLTHFGDRILEGCETGCHTGMIIIDLQKAFDMLDHELLLEKLDLINFSSETV